MLSVTNPNYADEEIICPTDATTNNTVDTDSNFVKMNYNEDVSVERTEIKEVCFNVNGELINALPIKELSANPVPQSV